MFGHDYKDDLKLGKQTLKVYHKPLNVDVLFIDNSGRMQTCLIKQDEYDEQINKWTDNIVQPYAILYYNGADNTFKYLCEPEGIKDFKDALAWIIWEDSTDNLTDWLKELEKILPSNMTITQLQKFIEKCEIEAED